MDDPLRIVGLRAENIKRLRAVEIHPEGDVVIIGGRNGQGKSSLLDGIWWALAGKSAQKDSPRPIRDGEAEASVTLDLGELVVERTWRGVDSVLTVRGASGQRVMSPQAILDALTGHMGFDPITFANQGPKAQRELLLGLVELPFDLDEIDAERRAAYDQRTDVNRQARALEARLDAEPVIVIPPDVPSIAVAMGEYAAANAQAHGNREVRAAFHRATEDVARTEQRVLEAQAALDVAIDMKEQAASTYRTRLIAFEAVGDDPDIAALDERVKEAEHWSEMRARADRRLDMQTDLDALEVQVRECATFIDEIDQRKAFGLANATMPIDGLGFGEEGGITYQGVPFSQASSAEKLRVATAIAMAGDPRIRVIIITNGSLLDDDNMAMIAEMADAHDFQVWIEVVGDGDGTAIIIEDGEVLT